MSHELGCQGSVSLAVTLLQLQKVREEICLLLGWWDHPGHWGWEVSQLDMVLGLQPQLIPNQHQELSRGHCY